MFAKLMFAFFSVAFFFGGFLFGAIALLELSRNVPVLAFLYAVGAFSAFAGAAFWGYYAVCKQDLSD